MEHRKTKMCQTMGGHKFLKIFRGGDKGLTTNAAPSAPEFHVNCGEQLAWLNVVDDVPIYDKGVVRKASV